MFVIALGLAAGELLFLLLKRGRGFVRDVFSEDDGHGSFGRVSFGLLIAAVLFYVIWQTVHARAIEWSNVGIFLGAGGAVTYTANKFATALSK